MNDAYTSWVAKGGNMSKSSLYQTKVELEKQMRDLQRMYPEYYANWLEEHESRERNNKSLISARKI